jgi:hypothetical protein
VGGRAAVPGWAPSGGGWRAAAAGPSKALVKKAVQNVEGAVVLPAGVRPGGTLAG